MVTDCMLCLFRVWYIIPHARGIPNSLQGGKRLQSRGLHPTIPRPLRRCALCRGHQPRQPRPIRKGRSQKWRTLSSRRKTSAHDHRRSPLHHRSLLLRMDSCSKISLDTTRRCCWLHWSWLQHNLPTMHQRPSRHVWLVCCECHCREHFPAINIRLWSPSGSWTNVPKHGKNS